MLLELAVGEGEMIDMIQSLLVAVMIYLLFLNGGSFRDAVFHVRWVLLLEERGQRAIRIT